MELLLLMTCVSVAVNLIVIGFWKPWLGSYGTEKGKTLARKEDLDAILEEVKGVARAQKQIETALAGDLWHRQTFWNQKKEIYADFISVLHTLSTAYGDLELLFSFGGPGPWVGADATKWETIRARLEDGHDKIQNTFSLAKIFIDPQYLDCFKNFVDAPSFSDRQPPGLNREWCKASGEECNRLRHALIRSARKDLSNGLIVSTEQEVPDGH